MNVADCGNWGWGMMAAGSIWIAAFWGLLIGAIVALVRRGAAREA